MKLLLCIFAFIFCTQVTMAQNATININVLNSKLAEGQTYTHFGSAAPIKIINKRSKLSFQLTEASFFELMLYSDSGNRKSFSYTLLLSPGDHLNIIADFNKPAHKTIITGKGSKNNQPLISTLTRPDLESFYGDSLPGRVIQVINGYFTLQQQKLNRYIKTHHPSAEFIRLAKLNLAYYAPAAFYGFKNSNKFYGDRKAFARNIEPWNKIKDSLFATIQLSNDEATRVFNYRDMLSDLLLREKEALWTEAYMHPDAFYKEWYNTDSATGKALLNEDMQNLLTEKIIQHYLKGRAAEMAYALLLQSAKDQSNPQNIVNIYNRFITLFPNSKFKSSFDQWVQEVREKESTTLNSNMIIADGNGNNLSSLEEVLALTKGKTVLVDMWGTWCGPCREEMDKNGAAIKTYFKNKGLHYLYIANRDEEHQKVWKKLIVYFNLEGTHILANKQLSKDIMDKVKGDGYPTYFIIKKDGSFEKSNAGYPMNRGALIKQIEAAL